MSDEWIKERARQVAKMPVPRIKGIEQAMRDAHERGREKERKEREEALQLVLQPSFLARYEGKQRKAIHEAVEHLRERCAQKEKEQ